MAALVAAGGVKMGTFDGGTTRAKLSTVLSYTRQDFYEVEVIADPDNTGNLFFGPVTVDNAGTDAVLKLKAGASKVFRAGEFGLTMNLEALYVVGSAASQKCYISIIAASGRRIPTQR